VPDARDVPAPIADVQLGDSKAAITLADYRQALTRSSEAVEALLDAEAARTAHAAAPPVLTPVSARTFDFNSQR
jgi:hypothetical protein